MQAIKEKLSKKRVKKFSGDGTPADFSPLLKKYQDFPGNLKKNNCLFSITGVYYIPV